MSQSTEQLLDRARRGDVDAFAAVFEQHRPLLHRIACRLVGADDGEDVVMDTYLKVCIGPCSIASPADWWVPTMARTWSWIPT